MAEPFSVLWPAGAITEGTPTSGADDADLRYPRVPGEAPAATPTPAKSPAPALATPTPETAPPVATPHTAPAARTKDDAAVVVSGSPPTDRQDLARRAILGLIGPEATAQRFGTMQAESEAIEGTYAAQIDALHPLLKRRMAASERALSAIQEYKDELGKSQPTPPTLTKPPAVPDLKVRPWLDPEGKNALSVIAQQLGMLATGIAGLKLNAPKTALSQFKEAADNWRRDEIDRAQSNWQDFQATVEKMRAENEQAMQMYDIADKQYGTNVLAKQAAMIAETHAVGLEDASLMAAGMPYDLARQAHGAILQNTHLMQEAATRMGAVFARWDAAKTTLPTSPFRAIAEKHALESSIKAEPNPEKKADMQARVQILDASIAENQKAINEGRIAAAGLSETAKLMPAWLQQTQYVTRFQSRLGKLYGAYKTLDQAGLLPPTPTGYSAWTTWAQNQNPAAWKGANVQEALGVINTFFAPQTVGFDRTMLDDKGARFQQAYGTALKTPLMPLREFQGIAKVWAEESDQVKQYLGLQGQWLKTMGQGAGLSLPDLTPAEGE